MRACAAACRDHANRWRVSGCCYTFQGASKSCYFGRVGGAPSPIAANTGSARYAAQCVPRAAAAACDAPPAPPAPPAAPAPAGDALYVTNATGAAGSGALDDPFTSLQTCVDELASRPPGSSCLLLDGVYRYNATVEVRGVHGDASAYSRIAAAPGASATRSSTPGRISRGSPTVATTGSRCMSGRAHSRPATAPT